MVKRCTASTSFAPVYSGIAMWREPAGRSCSCMRCALLRKLNENLALRRIAANRMFAERGLFVDRSMVISTAVAALKDAV